MSKLSAAEALYHRLARVAPLDALDLSGSEVQSLADLEKKLRDRKNRAIINAVLEAGEVLVKAGEQAAEGATRFVLQFGDIVSSHGGAFLDPELQWHLRRWRSGRLAGQALERDIDTWLARVGRSGAPPKPALNPADTAAYAEAMDRWIDKLVDWAVVNKLDTAVPGSPLEYARGPRQGLPNLRLQLYLGEHYRAYLRGATHDPRIPSPQRSRWQSLTRVWPPAGPDAVGDLLTMLNNPAALRATVREVAAQTRVALDRFDADRAASLLEALVERYKQNGVLDADGAGRLMGRKPLSQHEFVYRVVAGLDMMEDEADAIFAPLDDLLEVAGIESFLEQVIHKSGYEHGYRFEVFLAARALFEGYPPSDLWMQVFVNGKMGPDMVRIIERAGQRMARIIQAKSYQSLDDLLGEGGVGEIKRQLLSDLKRVAGDGFHVTGPDGVTRLPVDALIEFKLDWLRLRLSAFTIEGIDPAALRSLDPNARAEFHRLYVAPRVDAINTWLKSNELRAELGLKPGDVMPNFALRVDLVDQLLDEDAPIYQL